MFLTVSRIFIVLVFSSALSAAANAGTGLVNVKDFGAKGDGITDDTAAINAAINSASSLGGGAVLVPPGTYMIDAVDTHVQMKSNVNLQFSPSAIFQAITNSATHYAIILASGVSNAGIYGGTIQGDRATHTGTTGEWGMGIQLAGATNFSIVGAYISNCWGDGIYVSDDGDPTHPSRDVHIDRVTSDKNRRQGLSAINWIGGSITGLVFSNTNGTPPLAGIDLEPDLATQQVSGLGIYGNSFDNNAGDGIVFDGPSQRVFWIFVSRNTFSGNSHGVKISNSSYNTLSENKVYLNRGGGIYLLGASNYNVLNCNQVSQNNPLDLATSNILLANSSSYNVFFTNISASKKAPFVYAGVVVQVPTALDNVFIETRFVGSWGKQAFVDLGTGTIRNDPILWKRHCQDKRRRSPS